MQDHVPTRLAAILMAALATAFFQPPVAAADLADWDTAVGDPAAAKLARPAPAQYAWHEQERLMFVHFGVATWEGSEYDADGKTDLSKIDPAAFSGDALCAVAKAWGARQVLLVAKHVGGFCWWPTATTDYCTRRIPWRNGQGNLVKEVADACRRQGLALGIYLYPDDTRYTKDIGRSGKTDDPAKQEEWNRLYRQQWEEVLTLCGPDLVREVWLDGGCAIELGDILQRRAPNAVVFQGRNASIRWVGNEAGVANDPNWNTLSTADLKSGVATAAQSTPQGDAWAPAECDVTLYNHNWFWNPANERKRRTADQLLNIYLQSAGRGSVLLLNSTPNTDGLIPEGDQARYREFGQAIQREFGHPAGRIARLAGREVIIPLDTVQPINCVDLWEDYQYGHRIRRYEADARVKGQWTRVAEGTAVGRRKLDLFPEALADAIRVRVLEQVGTPLFRQVLVHKVSPALVAALGQTPALTRGAVATASSAHSAPYEAPYLVDGNPGTRWSASDQDRLSWVEIDLRRPRRVAALQASELADRVREFRIEVRNGPMESWRTVFTGGKIGSDFKTDLPPVTARHVRFHVTKLEGPAATLWELSLTDRPGAWEAVSVTDLPAGAPRQLDIDLCAQVVEPGQYELRVEGAPVTAAVPLFEGKPGAAQFLEKIDATTYRLNRTQALGEGASTAIRLTARATQDSKLKVLIRPR
jgi:alpha-L-fucosidase